MTYFLPTGLFQPCRESILKFSNPKHPSHMQKAIVQSRLVVQARYIYGGGKWAFINLTAPQFQSIDRSNTSILESIRASEHPLSSYMQWPGQRLQRSFPQTATQLKPNLPLPSTALRKPKLQALSTSFNTPLSPCRLALRENAVSKPRPLPLSRDSILSIHLF
jgi:hypothetical protein